ncbi:hypothetical protein Chor_009773, partial [Crotalus horridus]
GNSGVGKATAVDLARRGARVILACRDKARGDSAVCDIRRESGNSEVILMILDLANLNSVRAFAQTFLKSEPRLDILINNAGGCRADPPPSRGQPPGPLPADPPTPGPAEALCPEPGHNLGLDYALRWEDRLSDHPQAGKGVVA